MRVLRSSLLMFVLVFGFACTDDTVAPGDNDNNRVDPDKEIPAGARLVHTMPCSETQPVCAMDLPFGSSGPLRVKLLEADGTPIDAAAINYELKDTSSTGSTLESAQSGTNEDGIAEVELRSGNNGGTVEVVVSVGGNATGIADIKFTVAINAKGASSYRISFNHNGTADLKDIKVRAFAANVTCAEVAADHIRETTAGQNPMLTAVTQAQGVTAADGTLPVVVIPDIPNGTAYTIEARGKSRSNPDVESAFGCKDGNAPIENGESVEVLVDLNDNLPQVGGTYDVNHTFSVLGAVCPDAGGGVIPDGVCTAIELIGRLATDPASFFIGEDGGTDSGILGLIVDFLPDGSLKDTIQDFLGSNLISGVIRDKLNEFFENWIENNGPSWLKSGIDISADIFETLKEFKVGGTIRILREPTVAIDNAGNLVGTLAKEGEEYPGKQVWNDITVFWKGACAAGDEACRARTFSSNDLNAGNVVEGFFTGSVVPVTGEAGGYALVIDQHTLSLNYGVLILGILENIIIPSAFGDPNITSIDAAIEKLITSIFNGNGSACEQLATRVGTAETIVERLCDNLLDKASDGIRDYFTEKLTVNGADNLLIGTPAGKPCKIVEPATYGPDWTGKPLPYGETLGTERVECEWEMKIKVSASTTIDAPSTFVGTRTGFLQ